MKLKLPCWLVGHDWHLDRDKWNEWYPDTYLPNQVIPLKCHRCGNTAIKYPLGPPIEVVTP